MSVNGASLTAILVMFSQRLVYGTPKKESTKDCDTPEGLIVFCNHEEDRPESQSDPNFI